MTPLTDTEATQVGEVFDTHARFIEAVARRHSRAPQDVPDIVQSVGVQICRTLRGFRGDAGITTWLYRVTVNTAIDNWRLERRQLEKVREALQVNRPGAVRRSGTAFGVDAAGDQGDQEPRNGAGWSPDGAIAAPADQVDRLLQGERAAGLHEAIGRLRPLHASLMREELASSSVLRSSKQWSSKHRARQRLREVLSADPRFA